MHKVTATVVVDKKFALMNKKSLKLFILKVLLEEYIINSIFFCRKIKLKYNNYKYGIFRKIN